MRRLRPVSPDETFEALRSALSGGDAILPLSPAASAPEDLPAQVQQRVALVVATSGSTGRPKRVALSADALLSSAAASASALGGSGQWLLALPLHYIAGLNVLTRSIAAGTTPVVLEGRFEAEPFVAATAQLDAPLKFTALVPAQLARLLRSDHPDLLPALRRYERILIGGQAIPDDLLVSALELGLNVTRSYGSSETSGGCVYDQVPIGDTAMRVVDGELQLSGSVLAEGYLGDEGLTASRFVDDGGRWYRTGDTARIADGLLHVTGRLDDVIVSGGVKVALGEVERAVRALPGQADAIVVAVAHPEWGEAPAVVTTVPVPLESVRTAAGALGAAARPVRVVVVDRMPLLDSGKPDRVALRAAAEQPQDR